jgi:anion-transporting  ArsA/GET3 family ATPase
MEATMRKFFTIGLLLLSATTAHAGLDVTVADADVRAPEAIQPIQPLSAQRPDASVLAEKRQAMVQQKMIMQKQMMIRKQMAMQREMQRHPIRTRVHFAILKFKRKMHYAFR